MSQCLEKLLTTTVRGLFPSGVALCVTPNVARVVWINVFLKVEAAGAEPESSAQGCLTRLQTFCVIMNHHPLVASHALAVAVITVRPHWDPPGVVSMIAPLICMWLGYTRKIGGLRKSRVTRNSFVVARVQKTKVFGSGRRKTSAFGWCTAE